MNILIILNHMDIGGSQTQTISFAKFLALHKNKVFVASNGGELSKSLNNSEISHIKVPFPSMDLNLLSYTGEKIGSIPDDTLANKEVVPVGA